MSKRSPRCSTRSRILWTTLPALLVTSLLLPAVSAALAAPAPAQEEDTARRILSDSRYQTELPESEAAAPPVRSPGLSAIGRILLYVMVFLGAGLLLWWLVGEFILSYGRPDGGEEEDEEGDGLAGGRRGMEDPERLAGEGRYDEAIHALLLIAIARLSERLPSPPGPACTSRELLRILPMGRSARDALAGLVAEVETSLFGGVPAGADSYSRCRRSFRSLVREEGS
jgi:hypothetical protein